MGNKQIDPKGFLQELKAYLYDIDFNEHDERKITGLFTKYSGVLVYEKKETVIKNIPVFVDPLTNFVMPPQVSKDEIINFVKDVTGEPDFDKKKERKRKYVEPKQFCSFLLRTYTNMPLVDIAELFHYAPSGKPNHHTTIKHNAEMGRYLVLNVSPYGDYYEQFKKKFNVGTHNANGGDQCRTVRYADVPGIAV
jgi:hypothetical protein